MRAVAVVSVPQQGVGIGFTLDSQLPPPPLFLQLLASSHRPGWEWEVPEARAVSQREETQGGKSYLQHVYPTAKVSPGSIWTSQPTLFLCNWPLLLLPATGHWQQQRGSPSVWRQASDKAQSISQIGSMIPLRSATRLPGMGAGDPACQPGYLYLPVVPLVKHTMERSSGRGGCRSEKRHVLGRTRTAS